MPFPSRSGSGRTPHRTAAAPSAFPSSPHRREQPRHARTPLTLSLHGEVSVSRWEFSFSPRSSVDRDRTLDPLCEEVRSTPAKWITTICDSLTVSIPAVAGSF
ncbi:hypothetical protein JTB14_011080 [Gonioctena quinquepunctata]|nr:hypothetical protein JTB14_011080 [Gonioctena quinquepunctata]